MREWFRNFYLAIKTVGEGLYVTLWYFLQTYKRRAFTQQFEYPELPVPVKPRYRGFHRFDLTTCIGCDKCARACPVDCIYIEKIKNPVGKGFRVNGFKIDYTKCMFCALCVDPCPGRLHLHGIDLRSELLQPRRLHRRFRQAAAGDRLGTGDAESDGGGGVEAWQRAGVDQTARPAAAARNRAAASPAKISGRRAPRGGSVKGNGMLNKQAARKKILHGRRGQCGTRRWFGPLFRDITELANDLRERHERLSQRSTAPAAAALRRHIRRNCRPSSIATRIGCRNTSKSWRTWASS